jgi:hypothetical protein
MGQGDTYELEELGYSEGEDVPYESSVERGNITYHSIEWRFVWKTNY